MRTVAFVSVETEEAIGRVTWDGAGVVLDLPPVLKAELERGLVTEQGDTVRPEDGDAFLDELLDTFDGTAIRAVDVGTRVKLEARWMPRLLGSPESAMGSQRVDVRFADGRELRGVVVFNAEELELPSDFAEAEITDVSLANPYRDARGRFATADESVVADATPAGGRAVLSRVAATHREYLRSSPQSVRDAVEEYVEGSEINQAIHEAQSGGPPLGEVQRGFIAALQAAITQAPPLPAGGVTVWRAVDRWEGLEVRRGAVLRLAGFQSTTVDQKTAVAIATEEVTGPRADRPVLFKITARRGLYRGGQQRELLLPHQGRFRVTGVGRVGRLPVVMLEQV